MVSHALLLPSPQGPPVLRKRKLLGSGSAVPQEAQQARPRFPQRPRAPLHFTSPTMEKSPKGPSPFHAHKPAPCRFSSSQLGRAGNRSNFMTASASLNCEPSPIPVLILFSRPTPTLRAQRTSLAPPVTQSQDLVELGMMVISNHFLQRPTSSVSFRCRTVGLVVGFNPGTPAGQG